jgi:hypothetical protein
MRADGTAANKAAATSCSDASTAMSVTKHNAETFSDDDIIDGCKSVSTFTSIIIPPSSGSSEHPITYQHFIIDGGGTNDYGINSLKNWIVYDDLTITGTDVMAYRLNGENNVITNCSTTLTVGKVVTFVNDGEISNCTLVHTGSSGTANELIYSEMVGAADIVTINNNDITYNANDYMLFVRGDGVHNYTNNRVTVSGGAPLGLVYVNYATESGTLNITGTNTITNSVLIAESPIWINNGTWDLDIDGLTYNGSSNTAENEEIIYILNQAEPIVQNTHITTYNSVPHITLKSTGTASGVPQILNNTDIVLNGTTSYVYEVGTETTSAGDNNLDGTIISGNDITGPGASGTTHSIFVGYNKNAVIKNNRVRDIAYAVVLKGTTGITEYTAGGVWNNIFDTTLYGVRLKGVDDVKLINNDLIDTPLNISENLGSDPSTGTVIKNNIFYSSVEAGLINILDTSAITTTDWSNNIMYTSGNLYVAYQGDSKNYAEWVAAGYNTNSQNADPLLDPTTYKLMPGSPAINAGDPDTCATLVDSTDYDGLITCKDSLPVGNWRPSPYTGRTGVDIGPYGVHEDDRDVRVIVQ